MKFRTLTFSCLLMLCVVGTVFAQPKIDIVGGDSYDWGNVKPKDNPLKTTVSIKNVGDEELHITSVRPGCGCTTAPLDKDKLAPGESAEMKVTLNVGASTGPVTKAITISSNDPNRHEIAFYLKAEVKRALQFLPNQYLMFSEMKIGEISESKMSIKNSSSSKVLLSNFETPEGLVLSVGPNAEIMPGGQIELIAKVRPSKKGYYSGVVKFTTDNEDNPTVELQVYGNVTEATSPVYQNNATKN